MADRLTVTAYHEAAHAVVAHALGDKVAGASIVPGRGHSGVTSRDPQQRIGEDAAAAVGLPLPLQPSSLRRWVEVTCTVAAAGAEGELLARTEAAPPTPGVATALLEAPAPIPERVRKRWVYAELDDLPKSDAEVALDAAWLIAPDITTRMGLVRLCEAVARDLVRGHAAAVAAVARALLEHQELAGTDLVQIIEGTDDASHEAKAS